MDSTEIKSSSDDGLATVLRLFKNLANEASKGILALNERISLVAQGMRSLQRSITIQQQEIEYLHKAVEAQIKADTMNRIIALEDAWRRAGYPGAIPPVPETTLSNPLFLDFTKGTEL
jgi:hypothetical protein